MSENRGKFYNLDLIKTIPIADVCKRFGVELNLRSGKHWCKLRNEKSASVLIHEDTNTFYDFGSQEGGDVIQFVAQLKGTERKDAIRILAETFGVSPENNYGQYNSSELSDWEYAKIGLAGDLATKNFSYDIDKQSIERMYELSSRYAMPMNKLRQKYSKIYAKLLRERAFPYVRALRDSYYLSLYEEYRIYKNIGAEASFYQGHSLDRFRDGPIKELKLAESILGKACYGTDLRPPAGGEYDAAEDIRKLLNGELKFELGNTNYIGMKMAAERLNTVVKYQSVDFDRFVMGDLSDFTYSAFFKEGKIVVGYLFSDQAALGPLLEQMKSRENESLSGKIEAANEKQTAFCESRSDSSKLQGNKER